MIEKSDQSKHFFQNDIAYKTTDKHSTMKENENIMEKKSKEKKSLRDYLKPEYFIISQNAEWKAVFDTFNLIVIGYSCMTTVFFVTFDMKIPLTLK